MNRLNDIEFIGGNYIQLKFNIYKPDGTPLDLTQCSNVQWKMRYYGELEDTSILTKTLKDGITISNSNTAAVILQSKDTVDLAGKFVHQISLLDGDNKLFIPVQGNIIIHKNIN